jgi:two-component system cell cycle sensor histidine kinase/response regulator CckA
VRDVTAFLRAESERRQADAQVQHAQKLESLGMLAGGIAHDFNNILTAILGRSGLMASRLGSGHPARGHLRDMEQASRRAAALCQQLLAYAGKGRTRIGPIDLRSMVEEMSHVLSVSVSDEVTFLYDGLGDLPYIRGDSNQVRQVVMNLITNAAESFNGRKGTVTLRLSQRQVDDPLTIEGSVLLAPGPYVVLEVIDTGSGMDAATRKRMFEPFFTTKPRGRGLGMAAVLGIIHGHGGGLQVESSLGTGTTMRALFPIFIGPPPEFTPAAALPALQPTGMVLVVDDEDSIRRTTRDMLIHLGFQTLEASSGAEAIALFQTAQSRICAVVLDLTMPGLDGHQTLRLLKEQAPGVQVILASGYSREEVARTLGNADIAAFLQKPFDIETLTNALHQVLDNSARVKLPIT